jgi:hypothetical protein
VFVVKAGAYPRETVFSCSNLGQATALGHKQQTWLERLARSKHSNLMQKFVTYGREKFYNIVPWCLYYKGVTILLYDCNGCGLYYEHVMIVNYASSSLN